MEKDESCANSSVRFVLSLHIRKSVENPYPNQDRVKDKYYLISGFIYCPIINM